MSGCRRVGPLLDGYHDGELGSFRRRRVERHLADCDGCRHELASLRRIGDWLRASDDAISGPDLWSAIATRLPRHRPVAEAATARPAWRWAAPALAGGVGAALAGLLLFGSPPPPSPEAIVAANEASGVVRSIFAPKRPVMVFEAEQRDDPTIIWLVDELGERTPEVSTSVGI